MRLVMMPMRDTIFWSAECVSREFEWSTYVAVLKIWCGPSQKTEKKTRSHRVTQVCAKHKEANAKVRTNNKQMAPNNESTTPSISTSNPETNKSSITQLTPTESSTAIQNWCSLIQYPTVSALAPNDGSYTACASFLHSLLSSIPVLTDVHYLEESPKNCPVVVAKWKGVDETLPVLLLNSHYDVVPANKEDWSVDPFGAVRKDGRVYGRGTQDMKCV
eukprot:465849-Ditylum_brightwellii.AAC.2